MAKPWTCPRCSRTFARRAQPHSCAPRTTFDSHFRNREPGVKKIAVAIVRALVATRVPHEIVPVQTRILGRGKRVFLVLIPCRGRLEGELVLPGPVPHPLLGRIVAYGRWSVHRFRIPVGTALDAAFRRLLKVAALAGQA